MGLFGAITCDYHCRDYRFIATNNILFFVVKKMMCLKIPKKNISIWIGRRARKVTQIRRNAKLNEEIPHKNIKIK